MTLDASALEIAPIATGWTVIDEFANRFVYFYAGYVLAPSIFALAAQVQAKPAKAILAIILWSAINATLVFSGYAELPFVSLALGLVGAGAVVCLATLWARTDAAPPLRYCGQNSIVIYLAFFLPMAATRTLLLKSAWIADIGTVSLVVTAAGVIGALCLYWAVRDSRLRFLFERPERFWLTPRKQLALQPAE